MTTCTFAGHREVYQPMINAKIEKAIRELLQTDSEFIFYTGGMGEFDSKCASAVRLAKRKYPHLKICLALVLPYMSNRLNTEKSYYEYYYDEIIIPEELCGVHYKAAIQKRNRWMVDRADCLIAYLFRDFGGAYETVKYAKKQGKPVINLAEQKLNCTFDIALPYGYSKRKTGVKTMSDTYFDLPSRMEDSFPEIDSDIVTNLRKTSEEYADIQQQISDLKKRFPCIMKVMEDKGEIHLTAEEHAAFVQCLRLSRKLDDMERLQLYFRGHTDAVAYLKKIKAI